MDLLSKLKGKLIVSCQALSGEPLYGSFIMGRMALSAKEGGAFAIRAQGVDDIQEIKKTTRLPVIGLIKRNYEDSPIYITPTMAEVEDLLTTECEIIALDMTNRPRPADEKAENLLMRIHKSKRLALADISTYDEGVAAEKMGADAVSTTLSGYTPYSPQLEGPDTELIAKLAKKLSVPVFAEGRINTPDDITRVMSAGAYAPIVGSAITRPQLITAKFAQKL